MHTRTQIYIYKTPNTVIWIMKYNFNPINNKMEVCLTWTIYDEAGKSWTLPDFYLTNHYRIYCNTDFAWLSVSAQVCKKWWKTELLSLYCSVYQVWKLINYGTSSKAWRDICAQIHTSTLLALVLPGRITEIQSHRTVTSEYCLDIPYSITRWASTLRVYKSVKEHTAVRGKCHHISLRKLPKSFYFTVYWSKHRKQINKWVNGQKSYLSSSLFWMEATTVLIFQLRSEIKLSGYLMAHCF